MHHYIHMLLYNIVVKPRLDMNKDSIKKGIMKIFDGISKNTILKKLE